MKKKITFTLKADYKRKIDDIHQHIQEVKRGTGVVKSKKMCIRDSAPADDIRFAQRETAYLVKHSHDLLLIDRFAISQFKNRSH